MSAAGTNRVRLTTGKGDTSSPTWSPDGKRIAFSDLNKAGGKRYDIYVIDADGSDLRKLIGSSSNDLSPAWSPNGSQIMFERDRSLWTARPDGKNQRRLRAGTSPAWAYDGRRIAFDFRGDIWTANATGGGARGVVDITKLGERHGLVSRRAMDRIRNRGSRRPHPHPPRRNGLRSPSRTRAGFSTPSLPGSRSGSAANRRVLSTRCDQRLGGFTPARSARGSLHGRARGLRASAQ